MIDQEAAYQEIHVKQVVNGKQTKEKVGGYQTPQLPVRHHEIPIEIQIERRNNVQSAHGGSQKGTRQIQARHGRDFHVPRHEVHFRTRNTHLGSRPGSSTEIHVAFWLLAC